MEPREGLGFPEAYSQQVRESDLEPTVLRGDMRPSSRLEYSQGISASGDSGRRRKGLRPR
jgi:hypothetical protein